MKTENPNPSNPDKQDLFLVLKAAGHWLLGVSGVVALVGIFVLDIFVLKNEVGEGALTELAQEWLLAFSAFAVARRAWYDSAERGFAILWVGLLVAMLLREMDGLFDRLVWHGFWKIPVTVWLILILFLAWRNRATILPAMARFTTTSACMQIMIGLLLVMVFSRLIGMKNIWINLQEEPPLRTVKNAVEEVTELLGYGFIALSAWRYERATGKHWQPGCWTKSVVESRSET